MSYVLYAQYYYSTPLTEIDGERERARARIGHSINIVQACLFFFF